MLTRAGILRRLERIDAPTVLVVGESGTGKDLIARAIHESGPRKDGPLMEVDCASLPEHLIESELFGHERGAFTDARTMKHGLFEVARGGTIFLDEIGEMTPNTQAKLLRALQERTIRRVGGRENIDVDVRIVAATNKDITEAVRRGEFREDLYYRLNVVTVYLPELRERKEDIPLLLESFLKELAPDGAPCHFSTDALRTLQNYSWPGNVRELRNAVECALTIGRPPTLGIEDLPPHVTGLTKVSGAERTGGPRTLDDVERVHILRVLDELHQNHTRAAEVLGIDRRTLYRKLDKYKIEYSE